jgi:hypothetical protein
VRSPGLGTGPRITPAKPSGGNYRANPRWYCVEVATFKYEPTPEESEFWRVFELVRTDVRAAITSFQIFLTIYNLKAAEPEIQVKIRSFPEFWSITLFSLQTTFFISFGRVFDTARDSLSIQKLVRIAEQYAPIFSRKFLLARKRFDNRIAGDDPQWLLDYVREAWEPTRADLEDLRKSLDPLFSKFKEIYDPIRNKIYAHRSKEDETVVYELFSKTLIGDVQRILHFVHTLLWALQEMAYNGRKPELQNFSDYDHYLEKLQVETETFLRRLV